MFLCDMQGALTFFIAGAILPGFENAVHDARHVKPTRRIGMPVTTFDPKLGPLTAESLTAMADIIATNR
jgi:hypothetical protein